MGEPAAAERQWRDLVRDGENWKHLNLFSFQMAVEGNVIENLSRRAGPFLKTLILKGCKNIGDNAIRIFAKHCWQIEVLNLRECREITDGACAALGRHSKKLRSLNLDCCHKISDDSLNAIGNGCGELEHLDISWNRNITYEGFAHLAEGCPNMKSLRCAGVEQLDNDCLTLFGAKFPQLILINVLKCTRVTDEGVVKVAEGCPLLLSVCLSSISPHNITDTSLTALGLHCFNIRCLELSGCSGVSDQGFLQMTRHRSDAHPLEMLDVEECNQLTNLTLQNFAANCPNLRELILSHCDMVTDDGIKALCQSPGAQHSLEKLKLDNCPQISDMSLEYLSNSCPHLREIDLFDCQLITRAGISSMKNRLPNINVHAYFAPATPPPPDFPSRRRCRCCTVL